MAEVNFLPRSLRTCSSLNKIYSAQPLPPWWFLCSSTKTSLHIFMEKDKRFQCVYLSSLFSLKLAFQGGLSKPGSLHNNGLNGQRRRARDSLRNPDLCPASLPPVTLREINYIPRLPPTHWTGIIKVKGLANDLQPFPLIWCEYMPWSIYWSSCYQCLWFQTFVLCRLLVCFE